MRNIPIFTAEYGIASLILDQIPYTATAYVHIRSVSNLGAFLEECKDFCRAAGAEKIFATGARLDDYPPVYEIFTFKRPLRREEQPLTASLVQISEQTLDQWLDAYHSAIAHIDGAAYLSKLEAKRLLLDGHTYFVFDDNRLLGIGIVKGENIDVIASLVPGCGTRVFHTLCQCLSGPDVVVNVASTNLRAIRFYKKLGFALDSCKEKWYQIL